MNSNEKVYARIGFRKGLPNVGSKASQIVAIAEIHSLSGQMPYFALTSEIRIGREIDSCGMNHEAIAEHFPQLAKFLKWHLVSPEGPMHYLANAAYWLKESNFENLKSTIVYGALDSDATVDLEQIHPNDLGAFLRNRLPALLDAWRKDMSELFSDSNGKGYVDVAALAGIGIHAQREQETGT